MGHIYIIKNTKNSLVYVGQTRRAIERRFARHKADAIKERNSGRKFYTAMNKVGLDNFYIEELENCVNSLLDEREKFWISFFDSYVNGYNSTTGGASRPLYDHDEIAKVLKVNPRPAEVARQFGCSADVTREVAQENNISVISAGNEMFLDKVKSIIQCDVFGNELKTFDSVANAARWLVENGAAKTTNNNIGGIKQKICNVAQGKRKNAYGYTWKYENGNDLAIAV